VHHIAVAATAVLRAIQTGSLPRLRSALAQPRTGISGREMVGAAGRAWQPGLAALVKAGGDLNSVYRNYRALHALIQEDPHKAGALTPQRVACLDWMLAHGADPELPGAWPAARALVIAALQGEWAYVDAIRKAGATINVFTAAALGDKQRVSAFLAKDRTLAKSANEGGALTALHCAAGSQLGRTRERTATGLVGCARLLLDAGADPNALATSWGQNVSVAYFAIRANQPALLRVLLDHGADALEAFPTAVWIAQWDTADMLIKEHGVRIDAARGGDRPLLNNLVRWGQFQLARELLKRGASPNVADAHGWTAMHQAASRGNAAMWQALVDAGGDETRRDRKGYTPRQVGKVRDVVRVVRKAARSV
jgi:ankyrin repeat protein